VFHHGDLLREALGASVEGVDLDYSVEETLLGTGGGLALARSASARGPCSS